MLGRVTDFRMPAALLLAAMLLPLAGFAQTPAQTAHAGLRTSSYSASPLERSAPTPAATVKPPNRLSPELIGDIAAAHRQFRTAIAAYAQAPQMTAVLLNKTGIAYEMLHDFRDAVRCYKDALKLNPNSAQVYNNLGTLYGLVRDFQKADRSYRMALKLDPNSPLFLRNFGTNLLARHKFAEGWDAYRRALAVDPAIFQDGGGPTVGNAAAVHTRGAMYYYIALGCARTGDESCAVENLREAIDRGFASPKEIATDKGFASLRQNHAFQHLLHEEGFR